ncbi:MAG: GNAT family N-acetyltransferase [Spirochaetia bacterium]|nr:GNAT family N-acetyltransferase [Spirochaetia bacterium]
MKISKRDRSELSDMTGDYYNHLTAAMDDMYDEGIIPSCDFFQIETETGVCGFFAVNEDNTILQFYLKDREHPDPIFDAVISSSKIEKALCCSNDPMFYEQCKRKAINTENHDFMFHESKKVLKTIPFEGILMKKPEIDKLEEMLLYFEGIGMGGGWLRDYMTQRIETASILLFRYKGVIIGTGEIRPSNYSKGYANVGMTVSADYRRRGLGCYILSSMREMANEKNLKAICSTDNANIASYNTIIKSGFTCYHKIEEISF